MIGGSVRRFDLYDFFSVLLPGIAFILALSPFLPEKTNVSSVWAVLPILAGGFVIGRAIHSMTVIIEDPPKGKPSEVGRFRWLVFVLPVNAFCRSFAKETHRDKFVKELREPAILNEELVDGFYEECVETFSSIQLPESRADVKPNKYPRLPPGKEAETLGERTTMAWQDVKKKWKSDEELVLDFLHERSVKYGILQGRMKKSSDRLLYESLYGLVRSYVHIDSCGRSRTFQAVYAFYRSMWFVSFSVFIIYLSYSALRISNQNTGLVGHETYISWLGIPDFAILLASLIVAYGGYVTFSEAMKDYQDYFVQYLISDFFLLAENQEIKGGVPVADAAKAARTTSGREERDSKEEV